MSNEPGIEGGGDPAPRKPPLQGALNFRDLGGYPAADGRRVKWRTLYRSGSTHELTAADLRALAAAGVRFAYDLRSNVERRRQPSRLTDIAGLRYRCFEHDHSPADLCAALQSFAGRPEHSRALMASIYRQMPYSFRDGLGDLFRHLIDGELPLVFNCAAGKDRTGVAAALTLSALGVPRPLILEDYLLTADCFEESCRVVMGSTAGGLFDGIARDVWEPVMRVDPDYLQAMFAAIDDSHGSVDAYLESQLGVDRAALDRLRDHLLF